MRALLDVNVLVALLDATHVHHRVASDWLARHLRSGWASCSMTQNGCLRILSLPSYPNSQPPAIVAERLGRALGDASHAFWPDAFSLLERGRVRWDRVLGARQITDAYLLALATQQGGRLVTLDRGISVDAIDGAAPRNLVTLG
jgi:uncharacterized protein